MMWNVVIEEWLAILRANEALMELLGGDHIYPAQSARPVQAPCVEYSAPITDVEEELFNPITIQVDVFAGPADVTTIMRLIRNLTHRDTSRELGGLRMWTQYIDGRVHDYQTDRGVAHQSLDFLFKPARSKYVNL